MIEQVLLHRFRILNTVLTALLMVFAISCTESDDIIPPGMGRLNMSIVCTPYSSTFTTRAATGNLWAPVSDAERIHQWWVVFVDENDVVAEIVTGDADGKEQDSFRFLVPAGCYTVYGFANISTATFNNLAIVKGSMMPDLSETKIATANNWDKDTPIPMTSRVGGQAITVIEAENQSFEVEVVRTMAKLQLDFTNMSVEQQFDILGFEIFPLTTDGYVSLLQPTESKNIVTSDSVALKVELATPIELQPYDNTHPELSEGSYWLYINETNATATKVRNQYSLRMKVKRHRDANVTVEEIRYGFTVNESTVGLNDPDTDVYGFTYINRNDWIKLPITIADWSFRVEALPFPPIAGFQARVLSADALSMTFNSGGYIFLKPMFRNNSDPDGVWRGFNDSAITFSVTDSYTELEDGTLSRLGADGTGFTVSGDLDIFETLLQVQSSGDIVGYLTNADIFGTVTVTLIIKLEGFYYQFEYNIVKA